MQSSKQPVLTQQLGDWLYEWVKRTPAHVLRRYLCVGLVVFWAVVAVYVSVHAG